MILISGPSENYTSLKVLEKWRGWKTFSEGFFQYEKSNDSWVTPITFKMCILFGEKAEKIHCIRARLSGTHWVVVIVGDQPACTVDILGNKGRGDSLFSSVKTHVIMVDRTDSKLLPLPQLSH